jgi:hypothetical protein
MSGGGKGGSTTSSVEIPAWLENAAQTNLARADQLSTIGYTPYYGPDVAALTPMQQASMQNTNQGASAFGMAAPTDAMAGMPQAQTFAGGVQGYSSGGLYDQALSELQTRRPGQFAALNAPFINPYTGAAPASPFGGGSLMPANQMISQGAQSSQDRGNAQQRDLAAIAAGAGPSTYINNTTMTPVQLSQYASTVGGANYNPQTDILTPEQRVMVESNTPEGQAARIAQEDIAMNITGGQATGFWDDVGNFMSNGEPTFDNPSSRGSYGGSLVTGSPSGATYGIPGIGGGILDNFMPFNDQMDRNTAAGADAAGSVLQPDGTYDISSWYPTTQPIAPAPAVLPKDNNNNDRGNYDNTPDPWRAGGSSQAETNLINSNMSDEDFWNEVEASDPRDKDSSSGGGGKLICTAMNKMGLLPDDIYALDAEFGLKVNREDRMLGDGYRLWARPVSEYIKRDTIGAKALRTFMRPITLAWAKEMAHKMRPEEYKTNYAGKVIMAIGHPICRAIGYAFIGGLAKKDA